MAEGAPSSPADDANSASTRAPSDSAAPGRIRAPAPPSGGGHSNRRRWALYAAGAVVLLYVLTFVRGLGWEWRSILTAKREAAPAFTGESVGTWPPAI